MNKIIFKNQIKKLFNDVDDNFFILIEEYKLFLQDWNKKTNLTRLDSEEKIYKDYFYESLFPFYNVDLSGNKKILDIGSGSGIPGVLLKMIYPNIELTILESNKRKCYFIKSLLEKLNVNGVIIINERAECIKNNQREQYDVVTSRAVANLETILEISVPYAKIGGEIIQVKTENYLNEIKDLNKMVDQMNCIVKEISHHISYNNFYHVLIIVTKLRKTPTLYPREWNKIIKGFNYE